MLTIDLITKNVDLNKNIFVAYSGGPDSTAVIHLLSLIQADRDLNVKAIHVNHNLSENSKLWESHCIEKCSKLNIDLIVESVDIRSDGGGLEAASRKARYQIFEKLLNKGDQLLLGHHIDDVAETVFMRLLRGTGIEGMEGPHEKRAIGRGILIRPLLEVSKKQILDYLSNEKINFIDDDSNHSNNFDRNFLRNKIFPLLEERWKNFPKRIGKTSSILRNHNKVYAELINQEYGELIANNIDLKKIRTLPEQIVVDILRFSIKKCNIAAPNSKIIEEIIKTFIHSNPGPKSLVTWSRSDKEEVAGKITYENGCIIISKR